MIPSSSSTVMVSGCFDLLHSGHIAFLEAAARFGDLLVAVGSDQTVTQLKGRPPVCSEEERLYHVRALRCVREAFLAGGFGYLDFASELRSRRPTHFVVNDDGDRPEKRALCRELGVEYHVLQRTPPFPGAERSTTSLREHAQLPYRIDLAGGWLDQPRVSRLHAGAVIVASILADHRLEPRSGLASSTRATAERLWGTRLPTGSPIERARQLFACENPPGTVDVSGSQDALGIVLPGVSRLHYAGDYWPREIERITDDETLAWLESKLWLQWLDSRPEPFDVWQGAALDASKSAVLAAASDRCWEAIQRRDFSRLAQSIHDTFQAQTALFPSMTNPTVAAALARLPKMVRGAKLAGAGGLGYLILAADERPPGAIPIQIRRPEMDSL